MPRGTPIHVHLLDDAEVRRFSEVAEEFCQLVEKVDKLPKVFFLQRLDELLPLVYSLAHRLPDPFNWADDDETEYESGPEGMTTKEWIALVTEWEQRLEQKLSPHGAFYFVYDPVDPVNHEVVDSHLARNLAEIYADLKGGFIQYARSSDDEKVQALWDWRFGLAHNWGGHAAEAVLPIHRLLHSHYDEDDEVFDI